MILKYLILFFSGFVYDILLRLFFFRYQYKVKNSGTHFYHSHISVHMIDGQYGSLIVRDPPNLNPHYKLYNEDNPEHVIIISDLMHELSLERYPGRYRTNRGQTAENFLINGRGNWTVSKNLLKIIY